jgi:hypothetical protein
VLADAFQSEIVTEIEALIGPASADGWDMEAIETAARRQVLRVAARAIQQRLNADTSDHVGPPPERCHLTGFATTQKVKR